MKIFPRTSLNSARNRFLTDWASRWPDRGHRQEPSAASISRTLASAGERPSSSEWRSRLLTASLSRWISLHGNVRSTGFGGGLREAASLRSIEDSECLWLGCESVRRIERKFRHHDQAVSGRARRRKRSSVR